MEKKLIYLHVQREKLRPDRHFRDNELMLKKGTVLF